MSNYVLRTNNVYISSDSNEHDDSIENNNYCRNRNKNSSTQSYGLFPHPYGRGAGVSALVLTLTPLLKGCFLLFL